MSRKNFTAIAALLKRHADEAASKANGYAALVSLIVEMADYLATTNPQFNRERFLDACGI
jgi:hypothetical protein